MEPVTPINPNQPAIPVHPATQGPISRPSGLISPSRLFQGPSGDNLMHPAMIPDTDAPRNDWKLVVIDVLVVIGAALFGYSFARYLAGGFSFWFVLGALFFWSAMSVLEGFLSRDFSRRFIIILLEALALVAFFSVDAWQVLAVTVIIVAACLLWGYFSGWRELHNSIEVRFFAVSRRVAGNVITGAVIFMIVMYGSSVNSNGSVFVSRSGFNTFFDWTASFVNNFYPNIPFDGTFGSFAQAVAQTELQGNSAFQNLTPAEQSTALAQSADQIAGTFSGSSSSSTSTPIVAATLAEPTSNAFYAYFSSLTGQLQGKFGNAFVGIWGLILFIVLRSIGIVVVWAAQLVSLIFYEILLATGFMKITEQPATRESVEY